MATDQEIESALQEAIEKYLLNQTGHDRWNIMLKLGSREYRNIGKLGIELAVEGGRRPWIGSQTFYVSGLNRDGRVAVKSTIAKVQSVLFARQQIKKGDIIRAIDIELRQHEGRVPSSALSSLDQVVGMEAKRSVSENTILQENHVQAPIQVQRGETVLVTSRTGGITVKTYVVARQDGAMGDLVQVETLDGDERFAARVSGSRSLEVLAPGTQAKDYATLDRRSLRR